MTGTSWLIDSQRIASKIKNASGSLDPSKHKWVSNPSKQCPRCNHIIDNSDVAHQWPGLPKGVKFDPSDQELLWHLLAKHGKTGAKPHPFIDEFIPTVEGHDGICYTHPQKLPGVKQDGSVSHFFHRTFKAYNTGTRKRRKINTNDLMDQRWHKTGKTKPVIVNGKPLGCKKIMVLYVSTVKGVKPQKTNWVVHQYHLGTGEDEKDGEYVVSKLFFQQQVPPKEEIEQDLTTTDAVETIAAEPDLPSTLLSQEVHVSDSSDNNIPQNNEHTTAQKNGNPEMYMEEIVAEENSIYLSIKKPEETIVEENGMLPSFEKPEEAIVEENVMLPSFEKPEEAFVEENGMFPSFEKTEETIVEENDMQPSFENPEDGNNPSSQDQKWWEGESQFLLDSQQLADGLGMVDEFLQSQSQSQTSCGDGDIKPRLAVYAQLPVEDLKKDLEECQSSDGTNLELENASEFRLSQIEFSQDSFTAWADGKMID